MARYGLGSFDCCGRLAAAFALRMSFLRYRDEAALDLAVAFLLNCQVFLDSWAALQFVMTDVRPELGAVERAMRWVTKVERRSKST